MSDGPKLTPKQRRFVEEYLIDLNATQAAKRSGYSEKTAHVIGTENLSKPAIQQAVHAAQKERSERTGITADRVLEELAKIGFADIRKAVDWNGADVSLRSSEEIDDMTAAAISEVSLTQAGVKIKMIDKKGALDSLGRHLGLFVDRNEVSGPGGQPIQPVMNISLSGGTKAKD